MAIFNESNPESYRSIYGSLFSEFGEELTIKIHKAYAGRQISFPKKLYTEYDVNLEEDGTFVIWWRMSVAKAFLSTRHYPIYKNAIAAMGIIAYEVQQVFLVVEEA